jgi:hypothetical protein
MLVSGEKIANPYFKTVSHLSAFTPAQEQGKRQAKECHAVRPCIFDH